MSVRPTETVYFIYLNPSTIQLNKTDKNMQYTSDSMPIESIYGDKLKDRRWIKARYLILNRDKFTCQICSAKKEWGYQMQVHHIKYINNKEPWEYPPSYLVTLCIRCHRKVHCLEPEKQPYAKSISIQKILSKMEVING